MSFERQLIWKVYNESDTFIETLDDIVGDLSISKQINGGDSEFTFQLDRKMDDFDENNSVKFNNRVRVYLKDSFNTNGDKLVAYGYIVSYKPFLRGKKEGVEVTCLSAISKLSNDFYRQGTSMNEGEDEGVNLGVQIAGQRVDQMMQTIINHYRSIESNSMISNDYTNVDTTTDNSGSPFSFTHNFFNMKHIEALRETTKFLPRNKSGGYWFYWRINTEGKLYLKNISSTADHTFKIGKHIKEISGNKTIEGLVNRVYFYNEKGKTDPDFIQMSKNNTSSQSNYDIISEYITDSKITNNSAADLLTESKIQDKKDPKVKITVVLNGVYDLSSIEPGQTCKILNVKNNPYKVGSDEILLINSIQYDVDSAKLELSEPSDRFEDIVEAERQRLDKEMTWFGHITQTLTAAQLGPANRTWSSTVKLSPTTGAEAYRQVDWTAGIFYLPSGTSGSAGKRVIDAGDTTTRLGGSPMVAGTEYYLYLDEETFNTAASVSESGASGTIKDGGNILYDSSKSWTTDQWKGYIVTIGSQTKIIASNTATVLKIEDRWTITDQTSSYTIRKMTLDISSSDETVSDLTKIVISNVQAAVNTSDVYLSDSEAVITPIRDSSIKINAQTQISKKSITAEEIKAGTITGDEIIANVSLTAPTITGGILQTATSGQRVVIDGATNDVRFYNSAGTFVGMFYGITGAVGLFSAGTPPGEIDLAQGNFVLKNGTFEINAGLSTMDFSVGPTYFLRMPSSGSSVQVGVGNFTPTSDAGSILGASNLRWSNAHLQKITLYGSSSTAMTFYGDGTTVTLDKNFATSSDGNSSLGTATNRWNTLFLYPEALGSAGTAGKIKFNSADNKLYYDNGTVWKEIATV